MAAKDLTAIGLEILQTARNELYLNLPYLDVALCSLDFQPGGGVTLSLATDGETLYYDGSFLSERYLRSRTAVDRAYLHVLLHCMLRHLWKKRGRVAELWDLACDVAVESILDELDYPCLAGGFVPAKQKFYGECRAEMPVLTAEGIYRHLLGWTCRSTRWPGSSGPFWWTTMACGTRTSRTRSSRSSGSRSGRASPKRPRQDWRRCWPARPPAARRCWSRSRWPTGTTWTTGPSSGGSPYPGR